MRTRVVADWSAIAINRFHRISSVTGSNSFLVLGGIAWIYRMGRDLGLVWVPACAGMTREF